MDPDLVRLILVVFGVLLVAGIYLWDRYRRALPRPRVPKRTPVKMSVDPATLEQTDAERAEPVVGDMVEHIPEMRVPTSQESSGVEAAPKRAGSELDPDPADIGEWSDSTHDRNPQFSMDLKFDAHGDSDYLSTDPALYSEVERKLVVVNLVVRDGVFRGAAIEKACAAVGLVMGEMSIYHRRDPVSGQALFSMASMLEPGSFPAGDMADFATPGLCLFTQLPGVRDGIEIYDEMLSTANQLAALLHAELQDDQHNKLTRQMQEHTREQIIEHRRKIKLTRSRH
jgi:cell division protein ZipA